LFIRLSNVDTWGLVFYRGIIPFFAVFVGMLLIYKLSFFKILFTSGYHGLIYIGTFSLTNITFVVSIQNTNVANTLVMIATAPMLSAIIGAIFLDTNINNCKTFIISEIIDKMGFSSEPQKHAKSNLQEFCLKKFKCLPEYKLLDKSGMDHKPIFKVSASIKDLEVVTATGSNLKNAEETAASRLLHILTHPNR